ncbi:hypothetical protein LIMNO130_30874 [Limnobacter sp. 130]|nr:hypothetical protein LIMNO130_30874 [Limnobacter sp. 130]
MYAIYGLYRDSPFMDTRQSCRELIPQNYAVCIRHLRALKLKMDLSVLAP